MQIKSSYFLKYVNAKKVLLAFICKSNPFLSIVLLRSYKILEISILTSFLSLRLVNFLQRFFFFSFTDYKEILTLEDFIFSPAVLGTELTHKNCV